MRGSGVGEDLRAPLDDVSGRDQGARARSRLAADGQEALKRALDGNDDPLMKLNWMLTNRALEYLGIGLLAAKPDGGDYCPVCELSTSCATSKDPCGKENCADALIPSAADFLAKEAAQAKA